MRRGRALVGGGGEVADDRVEERLEPDARSPSEPTSTGARIDSLTPLRRHASSSGVGDLLALEVLRQDVVVRLGGGLEQLVAAARHLVGHAVGDRRLDLLAALRT